MPARFVAVPRSKMRTSAPSCCSGAAVLVFLTRMRTLSPRCSRCRTKAEPMKPVAPVMRAFNSTLAVHRARDFARRQAVADDIPMPVHWRVVHPLVRRAKICGKDGCHVDHAFPARCGGRGKQVSRQSIACGARFGRTGAVTAVELVALAIEYENHV